MLYRISILWVIFVLIYAPVNGIPLTRSGVRDTGALAYREKIYVHHDRNFYLDKETMWLKVYVLDAMGDGFSDLSKVAYIELLDQENQPRVQAKIALENGTGNGAIQFPGNLPSGNYHLRAYTRWMKNFDPDNYFETTISFINTAQSFDPLFLHYRPHYILRYYADADVFNSQNFLFTLRDDYGNRWGGSGIILDAQDDTVATLHTSVPGIGHFTFPRTAGGNYSIVMHLSNGDSLRQNLTIPLSAGNNPQGKGAVDIQKTEIGREQPHTLDRINKKAPLTLTGLQSRYAPRSKVSFNLELSKTLSGKNAKLSMAVYLLDSLNTMQNEGVRAYPDFETFVEEEFPELALSNTANEQLRRELWQVYGQEFSISPNDEKSHIAPEYHGHIIQARVSDATSGSPAAGVKVYLSIPGGTVQLHVCESDASGMVHFDMPHFYGKQSIVLQTETPEKYDLKVWTPFSSDYTHTPVFKLVLDQADQEALNTRYRQMNILEAYFPDTLHNIPRDIHQPLSIFGPPDKVYLLDNYRRFITMEEVLREYVREVNVLSRGQDYQLRVFNSRVYRIKDYVRGVNDFIYHSDPFLFLDGIPVFQTNKFMAYDPLKVKKLEVVTSGYHFGPAFKKGIVSAYTYKNNAEGYSLASGDLLIDYEGLQRQVVFQSPEYKAGDNQRIPDFRNLLFWKAAIDTRQSKSMQFYTGDIKGNYHIVIRGFTMDGDPVFLTRTFSVE